MNILLLAYEFPPIIAAQSLRWFYLANALTARPDCHVHVLTTNIKDRWAFSGQLHPNITVHRCYPGPFVGFSGWLADRAQQDTDTASLPELKKTYTAAPPSRLQRLYMTVRGVLNQVIFPDVRSEWYPFAAYHLNQLLKQHAFQVVISSHEPGVDLMLGYRLKQQYPHLCWISDLADPLVTPYTPRWRRGLDTWFEKRVCQQSDVVLVTNKAVQDLLIQRHQLKAVEFIQVQQGFSAHPQAVSNTITKWVNHVFADKNRFTLLFTGNFYANFRNPSQLFQALSLMPEIHLIVAGSCVGFEQALADLDGQVTVLGQVDHFICLALQQSASVLLNIGNTQSYQVPGKLYEYVGAQRPILHLSQHQDDIVATLLSNLNRGRAVPNQANMIVAALENLYHLWQDQQLDQSYDLSLTRVQNYSWEAQADKLDDVLALYAG